MLGLRRSLILAGVIRSYFPGLVGLHLMLS